MVSFKKHSCKKVERRLRVFCESEACLPRAGAPFTSVRVKTAQFADGSAIHTFLRAPRKRILPEIGSQLPVKWASLIAHDME
jgi:hypothetical protein